MIIFLFRIFFFEAPQPPIFVSGRSGEEREKWVGLGLVKIPFAVVMLLTKMVCCFCGSFRFCFCRSFDSQIAKFVALSNSFRNLLLANDGRGCWLNTVQHGPGSGRHRIVDRHKTSVVRKYIVK